MFHRSRPPVRRPSLRVEPLEGRTVPTLIQAGFNDALGINVDPTADSPYKLGDTVVGYGTRGRSTT